MKKLKSIKNNLFVLYAPWRETFADAGDGEGGKGANRDHLLFHPSPNIRFLLVFKWSINDIFLFVSLKSHRKTSKMCCFVICLPPGRKLLLAPGMGIGGNQSGPIIFPPPNRMEYIRIILFIYVTYIYRFVSIHIHSYIFIYIHIIYIFIYLHIIYEIVYINIYMCIYLLYIGE